MSEQIRPGTSGGPFAREGCIYATITGCAAPAALVAVWCVPGVPTERRSPVCRQHLRYLHNTAQVLREEPCVVSEMEVRADAV